ncbi:hypothetical protein B0T24DRAFT_343078 [Lasiosphaeria ovina]|uniref:Uncharacterized protein n=1 Tax=Lasiosphaeria ovina TaxID=92902 RepID=A0AAE0N3I7_9PEZI|nr:hypothetical protein B0T24DRAFT_343078 [Lasiosphaeria ovina]
MTLDACAPQPLSIIGRPRLACPGLPCDSDGGREIWIPQSGIPGCMYPSMDVLDIFQKAHPNTYLRVLQNLPANLAAMRRLAEPAANRPTPKDASSVLCVPAVPAVDGLDQTRKLQDSGRPDQQRSATARTSTRLRECVYAQSWPQRQKAVEAINSPNIGWRQQQHTIRAPVTTVVGNASSRLRSKDDKRSSRKTGIPPGSVCIFTVCRSERFPQPVDSRRRHPRPPSKPRVLLLVYSTVHAPFVAQTQVWHLSVARAFKVVASRPRIEQRKRKDGQNARPTPRPEAPSELSGARCRRRPIRRTAAIPCHAGQMHVWPAFWNVEWRMAACRNIAGKPCPSLCAHVAQRHAVVCLLAARMFQLPWHCMTLSTEDSRSPSPEPVWNMETWDRY